MMPKSQSCLIAWDIRMSQKGSGYHLVGVYTNQPDVHARECSDIHRGTVCLDMHKSDWRPSFLARVVSTLTNPPESSIRMTVFAMSNEIFYHVSPLMINEAREWDLERALNEFVKNYGVTELAKTDEGKGHSFRYTTISDEDFQTIKIQLRALGLIRKSVKSRSVKDTQTYWTLTAYGDSVMHRLRAVEKELEEKS